MKKTATILMLLVSIFASSAAAHNPFNVNISYTPGIADLINSMTIYHLGYYDSFGQFHKAIGHNHYHGQTKCKVCAKHYKEYLHHSNKLIHNNQKNKKHISLHQHKKDHKKKGIKYYSRKHR